jgi:hypothetical protein
MTCILVPCVGTFKQYQSVFGELFHIPHKVEEVRIVSHIAKSGLWVPMFVRNWVHGVGDSINEIGERQVVIKGNAKFFSIQSDHFLSFLLGKLQIGIKGGPCSRWTESFCDSVSIIHWLGSGSGLGSGLGLVRLRVRLRI